MDRPMLEVNQLCAWWAAAQALFGVSLTVQPGELVVLQGLNGAGKSTLLKSLIGMGPSVTGSIRYGGVELLSQPSYVRAQAGLGYVPEDRRLFADLTVQENLLIAGGTRRKVNSQGQFDQVLSMFPALKTMLHRNAMQMSGGEQQMLSIARTLMTQPTLLLLDEPCEGIAPVLVESIATALLALKAQGIALLIAEQNEILASQADRIITLSAGQAVPL
jgi:branched-chain amino acid transport system ATP-binding protein